MSAPQTTPRDYFRVDQVRAMERIAIEELQLPDAVLMERAGQAAFALLRRRWPRARRIVVACGGGNNGGDGFVVARLAHQAGLQAVALRVGERPARGAARTALERLERAGGVYRPFSAEPLRTADVAVDALLGIGIDRPVAGAWGRAIDALNAGRAPVLALDLPSGLHGDTGALLGKAVRAAATITFIAPKQGLATGAATECAGATLCDALGLAAVVERFAPALEKLETNALRALLKPRPRAAHKGQFGRALTVGGGRGMGGAARLTGEAALRCGAGLVRVAADAETIAGLVGARPELIAHGVASGRGLIPLLAQSDAAALGPGLGRGRWARSLFRRVMRSALPLVVDADALRLLAARPQRRDNWILTPHPGEAAALLETTVDAVQADRIGAVRELVQRYGGVCLLKGAGSLVADAESIPAVCVEGNPGMAAPGMGDVLSGVLVALLAQGMALAEAARLGVCLHAAAGDRAARAGERGMAASDLFPHLRTLVNPRGAP